MHRCAQVGIGIVALVAVIGCGSEPEPLTIEEYASEICPAWLADLETAETWGEAARRTHDLYDALDVVPPEELRELHEAHLTFLEALIRFYEARPADEWHNPLEQLGSPQHVALRYIAEAQDNVDPDVRERMLELGC